METVNDMRARRVHPKGITAFKRREGFLEALCQERRVSLQLWVRGWVPCCAACVGKLLDIPICSVNEGRWCRQYTHSMWGLPVCVLKRKAINFFRVQHSAEVPVIRLPR